MTSINRPNSTRFRQSTSNQTSFWNVFRLIFVLCSFYLLGDALYRWNGFRYYATFFEFLPSVALTAIIWSIFVGLVALFLWFIIRTFEWFCLCMKWKPEKDILLLFVTILILLGTTILFSKKLILTFMHPTFFIKQVILLFVIVASLLLTWVFRNKSEKWIGLVQYHITIWVWLFGIFILLSIPLVYYHVWFKNSINPVAQTRDETNGVDYDRPNIILVTFDGLTARDMSLYGYEKPTTPFITEWAKNASTFTKLQAESNYTAPTVASLLTGKRVWTHQLYHPHGYKLDKSDSESMPLVLKKNGYYNMAFTASLIASVKSLGIDDSFDIAPHPSEFSIPTSFVGIVDKLLNRYFGNKIVLHDWILKADFILGKLLEHNSQIFSKISQTEVPPENIFNQFLEVLDDDPPEPFFAWIHLYPPHDPYLPPEPFMGMFDSSLELRNYKSQWEVFRYKSRDYPKRLQPTVDKLRARYDEFIRYSDKGFEDFITQLARRDKLKSTIVMLSADHGQSFEHNYLTHGYKYLYEQVTHIPLIIKGPGQFDQRIVNDLVEQIDIPATILDLAHISIPSWMEGRSLVPLMHGEKLPSRPSFSMNFEKNRSRGHQITKGTVAVWEGDYKLIYYIEENRAILFNLKTDPEELENLTNKEPETAQRLIELIQSNIESANKRIMNEWHPK